MAIWYIPPPRFGILYQENLATLPLKWACYLTQKIKGNLLEFFRVLHFAGREKKIINKKLLAVVAFKTFGSLPNLIFMSENFLTFLFCQRF
jgi:hypothetical protein